MSASIAVIHKARINGVCVSHLRFLPFLALRRRPLSRELLGSMSPLSSTDSVWMIVCGKTKQQLIVITVVAAN